LPAQRGPGDPRSGEHSDEDCSAPDGRVDPGIAAHPDDIVRRAALDAAYPLARDHLAFPEHTAVVLYVG
jgi:hypothetical protein